MNIITPASINLQQKKPNKYKKEINQQQFSNPSFRGNIPQGTQKAVKSLITAADKDVFDIFSKHYGEITNRMGEKVAKLATKDAGNKFATSLLRKNARFDLNVGVSSIKDKSIPAGLLESMAFPFITLPLYGASWVLNKVKSIPTPQNASATVTKGINKVKTKASELYYKPLLRVPRKINELNDKTAILKGINEKTQLIIEDFAGKKGTTSKAVMDAVLDKTDFSGIKPEDLQSVKKATKQLAKEANEYIKENLYKVSNKFFDKNTGNYNTAFERPLNRIVTGLVPVAFLAADAYNLSVLCGDDKETSEKEGKARAKQEVSRVFTTAFVQLVTLGAFTKLANTLPWFTPLTTAGTVLFSEWSSRKRLGKPVFFLSKDKAKEYNRNAENKNDAKKVEKTEVAKNTSAENKVETKKTTEVKNNTQVKEQPNKKQSFVPTGSEPAIFTSFKATDKTKPVEKEAKKDEPKKALINMDTFKKGVAALVIGGFAVSFLKNSSYVQNTKAMKKLNKIGDFFKAQYNKIAFKDFEISKAEYQHLMETLDDIGCKEIAEGHNLIMRKYGTEITANSTIKMLKHSLSSKGSDKAIKATIEKLQNSQLSLSEEDLKLVEKSLGAAIKNSKESISEHKFEDVAQKAIEIVKNRINRGKIKVQDKEQIEKLSDTILSTFSSAISENASKKYIQVETKAKPFLDIVIEPFKFIYSAAALPFRKIIKPICNLAATPITKKAADAELGLVDLTKTQSKINTIVKEVFGETKSSKGGKISQDVFASSMEQLQRKTSKYRNAQAELQRVKDYGGSEEAIKHAEKAVDEAKKKFQRYVNDAVEKSFNGVTQSKNKNTDVAMMTKLVSSTVTSSFLVADNYNMVMMKSDGEDKEGAKEKAYERIIQRLSALFYQALFINWFNSTFKSTYTSSLKGMAAVSIPNTLTTEILTRKSIGMPITKKSYEELYENEKKNENRKGFVGKYFKFMRLLTGKKPLKDRMPKDKKQDFTTELKPSNVEKAIKSTTAKVENSKTTNLLEKLTK